MGQYLPEILIGAALLLAAWWTSVNLKRRGVPGAGMTAHEKLERMRQVDGVKDDLRQMMRELEDLTERFSAQLEAKSGRLERLLAEANARIAELERLRGATGLVKPMIGAPVRVEPRREVEAVDPLSARVYELADGGRTSIEIARQLQEHVGKVELILALRSQGGL